MHYLLCNIFNSSLVFPLHHRLWSLYSLTFNLLQSQTAVHYRNILKLNVFFMMAKSQS